MQVNSINFYNPSFGSSRPKFDVQAHVGVMFDNLHNCKQNYNAQNIIDTVEGNNVKKVLVSSLSGLNPLGSDLFHSETDSAKEMEHLVGNDKVKLYPLLSCHPGISKDVNAISEFAKSGKFYGLKFHPTNTQQSVRDNFDTYSKYLSLADKEGLPCVFHSITDGKSDPVEIIRLAENHPKLPVILYHIDLMANPEQMGKTIDNISNSVKAGKSNLFIDISWLTGLFDNAEQNKNTIKQALEKLGSERILFGSDAPIGEMGDKEKYGQFSDFVEETVKEFYKDKPDVAEKALDNVFYNNAEDIFIEKKWYQKPIEENISKQTKSLASNKKPLWIVAGVAALGIAILTIKALLNDSKKTSEAEQHPSKVVKH